MTTKTTTERLSVIEEKLDQNAREHVELKSTLSCIDKKLDMAIASKADQSAVDIINNRIWWFAGLFIAAFVSMIVWLIQSK